MCLGPKSLFGKNLLKNYFPTDPFSLTQKTFQKEENGLDAQLDFEEFVHYLQDYQKDLKLVVKSINKKNAGVYFRAGVSNTCFVSVSLCQLLCWTDALKNFPLCL